MNYYLVRVCAGEGVLPSVLCSRVIKSLFFSFGSVLHLTDVSTVYTYSLLNLWKIYLCGYGANKVYMCRDGVFYIAFERDGMLFIFLLKIRTCWGKTQNHKYVQTERFSFPFEERLKTRWWQNVASFDFYYLPRLEGTLLSHQRHLSFSSNGKENLSLFTTFFSSYTPDRKKRKNTMVCLQSAIPSEERLPGFRVPSAPVSKLQKQWLSSFIHIN